MHSKKNSDLLLFNFPFKAMGCPCELQFYAPNDLLSQKAAQHVMADVCRLEQRYSRYRTDSFLAQINQIAEIGGDITVDDETAGLLNYAQTCYQLSDHLFDITSGILRRAWRFDLQTVPEDKEIETLLDKVGWHHLYWQAPILTFLKSGMEIDFGGIVKEYAADRAATLLSNAGIEYGIVNLGGDIRIINAHPDGSPWRIGIQHPRDKDQIWKTIPLKTGALASSGDYERCILIDGVRYGHILNPQTGYPVRYLAAVSVVADLCTVAGSAATIAMLKEDKGEAWLDALKLPYYSFLSN
jgi:thiamine biosynthesis lipoprotein